MSADLIERLHDIARDEDEAARDRINAIELILAYGYGRPLAGVVTAHVNAHEAVSENASEVAQLAAAYGAMIGASDDADDPGPVTITARSLPAPRRAIDDDEAAIVDRLAHEADDDEDEPVRPRVRVRRPTASRKADG
jgi:hypothetical protein